MESVFEAALESGVDVSHSEPGAAVETAHLSNTPSLVPKHLTQLDLNWLI